MTTTTSHLRQLLIDGTQGKWSCAEMEGRGWEIGAEDVVPITGITELLNEENAALIVAAINALPALLDVADAARQASRWAGTTNAGCGEAHTAYRTLREAIAKLEGENK